MAATEPKLFSDQAFIERFITAYLIRYDATGAAVAAGANPALAEDWGKRLKERNDVRQAVVDQQRALRLKNLVTLEAVLDEMTALAFANMQDYVDGGNVIKDVSTLTRRETAAITKIKTTVNQFGENVEIALCDKKEPLGVLLKYLGAADPEASKVEMNRHEEAMEQIRALRTLR